MQLTPGVGRLIIGRWQLPLTAAFSGCVRAIVPGNVVKGESIPLGVAQKAEQFLGFSGRQEGCDLEVLQQCIGIENPPWKNKTLRVMIPSFKPLLNRVFLSFGQ